MQSNVQVTPNNLALEKQVEELKKLGDLKSQYFFDLSYELRNSLMPMLSPIRSIFKQSKLNNKSPFLVKMMEKNRQQSLKLLNELLELSTLDASKLEAQEKAVPKQIVRETAKTEIGEHTKPAFEQKAATNHFTKIKGSSPPQADLLIIEENPIFCDYLCLLLGDLYRVQTAVNGKAALQILNRHQNSINLVISDIMPEMDGFRVMETMRSVKKWADLPIIFLAAKAENIGRLKAIHGGVNDYMLKPFEEVEFLARVSNLLQNHQKRLLSQEQKWLLDFEKSILENLSNFSFNLSMLSHKLAISPRQLRRRLKSLTGLSPHHYIQGLRFQKARNLLEQGELSSVKAVSLSVGLKDVKHFSRQFQKRFGKRPSSFLN